METRAPLPELRVISYFLGERMLEGILCLRVERLLVDELGGSELAERFGKLGFGQLYDALQHWLGKFLSDDGRRLQELLLPALQAIDPCGQHGLNRRGNGDLLDR